MFKTASQFSLYIETLAKEKRISCTDAILQYCEENYIDPADIKSYVNKTLKDKIMCEMQEAGLLKKTASLDV